MFNGASQREFPKSVPNYFPRKLSKISPRRISLESVSRRFSKMMFHTGFQESLPTDVPTRFRDKFQVRDYFPRKLPKRVPKGMSPKEIQNDAFEETCPRKFPTRASPLNPQPPYRPPTDVVNISMAVCSTAQKKEGDSASID